jgi:hypothetical protein
MNDEREESMNQRISLRARFAIGAAMLVAVAATWAAPLVAEQAPRPSSGDEFFIISSVNLKKNQLVLKRPTEVTVLMEVNDKTTCLDEEGKPVHLKDLRAGDTVFVASIRGKDGGFVATRIRKGYMTLEEVHSRYLNQ